MFTFENENDNDSYLILSKNHASDYGGGSGELLSARVRVARTMPAHAEERQNNFQKFSKKVVDFQN